MTLYTIFKNHQVNAPINLDLSMDITSAERMVKMLERYRDNMYCWYSIKEI